MKSFWVKKRIQIRTGHLFGMVGIGEKSVNEFSIDCRPRTKPLAIR